MLADVDPGVCKHFEPKFDKIQSEEEKITGDHEVVRHVELFPLCCSADMVDHLDHVEENYDVHAYGENVVGHNSVTPQSPRFSWRLDSVSLVFDKVLNTVPQAAVKATL